MTSRMTVGFLRSRGRRTGEWQGAGTVHARRAPWGWCAPRAAVLHFRPRAREAMRGKLRAAERGCGRVGRMRMRRRKEPGRAAGAWAPSAEGEPAAGQLGLAGAHRTFVVFGGDIWQRVQSEMIMCIYNNTHMCMCVLSPCASNMRWTLDQLLDPSIIPPIRVAITAATFPTLPRVVLHSALSPLERQLGKYP